MNEEPKSIWYKIWSRPIRFFFWLALLSFIACFGASVVLDQVSRGPNWSDSAALSVIFGLAILFVLALLGLIFSLIRPTRPLMAWAIRRWFFCIAVLFTLIALIYAEEDFRGKWAWNNFKHEWEAKGEKFDLASFIPPPVPDDQNFAMTPLLQPIYDFYRSTNGVRWRDTNGYARLGRVSIWAHDVDNKKTPDFGTADKLTDFGAWRDYYRSSTNFPQPEQSASPAQAVLTALGKFDAEMTELRAAAATRPLSRFPIHYEDEPPFGILLPHLAQMKALCQLCQLHALTLMDLGRGEAALADLQLGFRLSDSLRDEPFLIDHLVRLATLAIDLEGLHEGLARRVWDDAQLVRLEKYLASLDILAEYKTNMRGERSFNLSGTEYYRRMGFLAKPAELYDDGGAQHPPSLVNAINLLPGGLYYQNMISMARLHQEFTLAAVDEEKHRVFPQVSKDMTNTVAHLRMTPYSFFAKMLMPALARASLKSSRVQTSVDMARVACALERFRLTNGHWPDTLDALTPQLLEKIPADVIDGQPLRYRKNSDGGYVIYSIGWNEKDDGGVAALNENKKGDLENGDWVWSTK